MTDWSMTVATDSVLSMVSATDDFMIGDEFALIFDGSVIAWDAITSPGGFFSDAMTDLFLSAGLHTFSLSLTALAPGDPLGGPFMSGGASMTFGTASASAVVPLPAALPLGLAGLGMLGFVGWRRRRITA